MRYRMTVAGLAVAGALATAPAAAGAQVSDSAPAGAQVAASARGLTRYTLVEVGGNALPALVEKELRCREEVTAGALTLRDDGHWLLETTTREVCGDRTEEDRDTDDGTYSAQGATLRFLDDEGRAPSDKGWGIGTDIDLDELASGTLAGDGGLKVQLADGRTTLVFRR